jgi:hypothetical protein
MSKKRSPLRSPAAKAIVAEAETLGRAFARVEAGRKHNRLLFAKGGLTRFVPLSYGGRAHTEIRGRTLANYVRTTRHILTGATDRREA